MQEPIFTGPGIRSLAEKVKKREKSNYAVLQICTQGQMKMTIDFKILAFRKHSFGENTKEFYLQKYLLNFRLMHVYFYMKNPYH